MIVPVRDSVLTTGGSSWGGGSGVPSPMGQGRSCSTMDRAGFGAASGHSAGSPPRCGRAVGQGCVQSREPLTLLLAVLSRPVLSPGTLTSTCLQLPA